MKKIHVKVEVDLLIHADENVDIEDVINELQYDFSDTTGKADVQDSSILDFTVTDAR